MNNIIKILIIMTVCLFGIVTAKADDTELCYPPYWGGLLPGGSGQREAIKLYGKGLYRNYGDERVRYYYNKSKTHTLAIYFGIWNDVKEIIIYEGIKYPENKKIKNITPYISNWFNPYETFGKWHKLTIGAKKAEVLEWLGSPNKKISENEWEYQSKCACELPKGITVTFAGERLTEAKFWAAED